VCRESGPQQTHLGASTSVLLRHSKASKKRYAFLVFLIFKFLSSADLCMRNCLIFWLKILVGVWINFDTTSFQYLWPLNSSAGQTLTWLVVPFHPLRTAVLYHQQRLYTAAMVTGPRTTILHHSQVTKY